MCPNSPARRRIHCPGGLAVALLVSASVLPGCSSDAANEPNLKTKKPPGFIAFVGAGPADPLWPALKKSAESYARTFSRLELRCMNPTGNSAVDQVNLVKSLNDPKMRGLCINVISAEALTPVLDNMVSSGLVVVPMIHPLPPKLSSGYAGFDEDQIGERLVAAAAGFISRGTLMVVTAGQTDPAYGRRLRGFESAVATRPALEVLGESDCRGDELEARRIIRERSQRYPRLNAWVSLDDWPMHDPQLETDLPTGCKFVAFSADPARWGIVRTGRAVVIAPDVHGIGAQAVQFCMIGLQNPSQYSPRYIAPLRLVTAQNMDEFVNDWQKWAATLPATEPAAHP